MNLVVAGSKNLVVFLLCAVVVMLPFANAFNGLRRAHGHVSQVPFFSVPLSSRGLRSAVSRIPTNISRTKQTVTSKKTTSSKRESFPSNIIVLENQKNLNLKKIHSIISKASAASRKPSEDAFVPKVKAKTRKSSLYQKMLEERKAASEHDLTLHNDRNKLDPHEIPLAQGSFLFIVFINKRNVSNIHIFLDSDHKKHPTKVSY